MTHTHTRTFIPINIQTDSTPFPVGFRAPPPLPPLFQSRWLH